jgi:NTE family protein
VNIHANPSQARDHRSGKQSNAISVKSINLALQGGGAHGAFTWGVLDRLLEEPRIEIEGISATSAGAMNAAVLAYGMTMGGRDGARQALTNFWRCVAHAAWFSPLQPSIYDRLTSDHALSHSPAHLIFDIMSKVLSPYQFNPLDYNPLRSVLEQVVDFERLRAGCAVKLFISATNVRTGKVKVFTDNDICVDRVLASACLPFIYKAVEIDGDHYWDGGYMGNPAIFPLIYGCESRDVLVVHINPIERTTVPTTARDIMNRVNEISFNSSLMREMRAVAFVTKLIDDGKLDSGEVKRMLDHAISADDVMRELGVASKLNADWGFLKHLQKTGRDRAQAWLDQNFDSLGVDSTVDIRGAYL